MLPTNSRVCLFPYQLLRTFYFLWNQVCTVDNTNNIKLLRSSWCDLHTDFENIHTSRCVNLALELHETLYVLQYSIFFPFQTFSEYFLQMSKLMVLRDQGHHTARVKCCLSVPNNSTLNNITIVTDTSWCLQLVHNPSPGTIKADSHIACRAHAVPMPFPCHAVLLSAYNVSFPFDLHSVAVSDSHLPCHAHAVPMPFSGHAVFFKATTQHGHRETACGLPARVRLLPATTRSSTKIFIRSIAILLSTIHTYDCKEW